MTPSTQKALFLQTKMGDFILKDTEVYKPEAGELLIKIKAVGLNPIDWKLQKQDLPLLGDAYPAILGYDIAGEVVELGAGVNDFVKGDRVFCQGRLTPSNSGFQQYTLGLTATTAKIPDGISYEEAATLPTALSTAYGGLYNATPNGLGFTPPSRKQDQGIYSGVPLLVIGGSSSVGQTVIQFAKLSGFSPIITTASPSHTSELKTLGATHVVDRRLPIEEIAAEVKSVLGEHSLTAVYDAISLPETQDLGLRLLAPAGKIAIVLPPSEQATDGKVFNHILAVLRAPYQKKLLEVLYHDLISDWLASGAIKPNRVEVITGGLHGILGGLKKLENDEVSRAKLVIRPEETA